MALHQAGAGHIFSAVPKWQSSLPNTNRVLWLSNWKLESANQVFTNLKSNVPGDLLTNLMAAKFIGCWLIRIMIHTPQHFDATTHLDGNH
jgi:hypothetical protein